MLTHQSAQSYQATELPSFQPVRIQSGKNGPEVASARELYDKLGFDPSQWSRWHKKNILTNPFAKEGEDWIPFDMMSNDENQSLKNPNPTTDYVLAVDFAKRLCMLARTYQGEAIRRYFIQCERELLSKKGNQPAITGLVQVVNDLLERIIGLEGRIDRMHKVQERYLDAKAVQVNLDDLALKARRDKIMGMMSIMIRRQIGFSWTNFWDAFAKTYDLDIRHLSQKPGEHPLDVAIRHGHIEKVWEMMNWQ